MDLHLRGEAEQLAVRIAEHTGDTLDAVVIDALRDMHARLIPERTLEERLASITASQERVAAAIAKSGKPFPTQEEWDAENYDEWGVPR